MSEQSSEIWGCQLTDDEDGFDVCFVDKSVSGIWYALLISSGVLGFITGLLYSDLFAGFCFGLVGVLIAFVSFRVCVSHLRKAEQSCDAVQMWLHQDALQIEDVIRQENRKLSQKLDASWKQVRNMTKTLETERQKRADAVSLANDRIGRLKLQSNALRLGLKNASRDEIAAFINLEMRKFEKSEENRQKKIQAEQQKLLSDRKALQASLNRLEMAKADLAREKSELDRQQSLLADIPWMSRKFSLSDEQFDIRMGKRYFSVSEAERYLLMAKSNPTLDFMGCYVICNTTKHKFYVGQGTSVPKRVMQHFTGHGNADVYADYSVSHDEFLIFFQDVMLSPYFRLNDQERSLIAQYHAYDKGYNRTRGNT